MKAILNALTTVATMFGIFFIFKLIDAALMDLFHLQSNHPVLFIPPVAFMLVGFGIIWHTKRKMA